MAVVVEQPATATPIPRTMPAAARATSVLMCSLLGVTGSIRPPPVAWLDIAGNLGYSKRYENYSLGNACSTMLAQQVHPREPAVPASIPCHDPATGEALGEVPVDGPERVRAAV